jgi:hypothetical protein
MAAEHRRLTLEQAVDILLGNRVESVNSQSQPQAEDFASRLRNWTTSFSKWLPGRKNAAEASNVLSPSRLAAERAKRLREEVYSLYDGLYHNANTLGWVNPTGEYTESLVEEPPVMLVVKKADTGNPLIHIDLLEGNLLSEKHKTVSVALGKDGDDSSKVNFQRDSFISLKHIESESGSFTTSLKVMRDLALEIQPLQEIRALVEMGKGSRE